MPGPASAGRTDWRKPNKRSKELAFHVMLELFEYEVVYPGCRTPMTDATFEYLNLVLTEPEGDRKTDSSELEDDFEI